MLDIYDEFKEDSWLRESMFWNFFDLMCHRLYDPWFS